MQVGVALSVIHITYPSKKKKKKKKTMTVFYTCMYTQYLEVTDLTTKKKKKRTYLHTARQLQNEKIKKKQTRQEEHMIYEETETKQTIAIETPPAPTNSKPPKIDKYTNN